MTRRLAGAALALIAALSTAARAEDLGGQKQFRDIFVTLLQHDKHVSAADARKLIYALPEELRTPPASVFGESLEPLDALFRKHRPSELYQLGAKMPAQNVVWTGAFQQHGPVLLVVVPGIFGEFIVHSPFEEVFANRESAFSKQWQALYAKNAQGADKTDAVYSLHDLKATEKPLTEVFDVASIDDAQGHPLIKAVFLKPNFASLETLGTLQENTAIYLRRLTKLFKVIGRQKFYLVGYSRGAAVALNLAVAARAQAPWGPDVKGVVSLAGVVYGTPLADAAFTPGDPMHDLVGVLTGLAKDLHELPTDLKKDPTLRDEAHLLHLREQNWVLWGKAAAKIASIELHQPKPDPGLALEKVKQSAPGVRSTFTLIREFAWDQFKLLHKPQLTELEKADHWKNVARFKVMVDHVYKGTQALTTASRVGWWKTHVIPADMTLYAIGATMPDRARPERANHALFDAAGVCALTHDPVSTFVDSIDFHSLRMNYYQLTAANKGGELNDSQVPLQRIRFWPKLYRVLNPHQPDVKTYFLGVLGQDHWGLSFPVAFDQHNKKRNPFPRATLLKAIGTFIAAHP